MDVNLEQNAIDMTSGLRFESRPMLRQLDAMLLTAAFCLKRLAAKGDVLQLWRVAAGSLKRA